MAGIRRRGGKLEIGPPSTPRVFVKDDSTRKRVDALYSLVKETSQSQLKATENLISSLEQRLDKLISLAQSAENRFYSKVYFFGRFLMVGFIGEDAVEGILDRGPVQGE